MTVPHLSEAQRLDQRFPAYKDEFEIPTIGSLGISSEEKSASASSIYFCGNSLGLLPKATSKAINDELKAWSQRGVESHFNHPSPTGTPWMDIDLPLLPLIAPMVGAQTNEVAVMGSLTSNLNSMLMSFYRPGSSKIKILFEKMAFPSDYYAFVNLVQLHGYDPKDSLIQLSPREGEYTLRSEDIIKVIESEHENLALICFPGIQYYTGQYFDIPKITAAAKKFGITVGWDLAHAVGNVPLSLHDWDVDFACWCSYKYLNAGPGGIAGIFVHEKHTKENSEKQYPPRLAGWWGNDSKERFRMLEKFNPIDSALSYRQSNPSVLDVVALRSSLELFKRKGGIQVLREKSLAMTKFLEDILVESPFYITAANSFGDDKIGFTIITPFNPSERGCQLSLLFLPTKSDTMQQVSNHLHGLGIICDERRPNVIRLAPLPLYNTFEEITIVVQKINEAIENIVRNK